MKQVKQKPQDNIIPLKAEHSQSEDAAPESVWWMAGIQAAVALSIAVFVAVLAPTYAVSMVPEWFPPRAIIAAAVLGLVAAVFLSRAALWLPEPLFVLARRLPAVSGFVRHEFALVGLVLVLAIGAPVVANYWRPLQPVAPFTRAATARSAPTAPAASPAPVAVPRPAECRLKWNTSLCHLRMLESLRRYHIKPARRRRK